MINTIVNDKLQVYLLMKSPHGLAKSLAATMFDTGNHISVITMADDPYIPHSYTRLEGHPFEPTHEDLELMHITATGLLSEWPIWSLSELEDTDFIYLGAEPWPFDLYIRTMLMNELTLSLTWSQHDEYAHLATAYHLKD